MTRDAAAAGPATNGALAGSAPAAASGPPQARWEVLPYAPPSEALAIARALTVPPLLGSVVWSRGLHRHPSGVTGALDPELALAPIDRLGEAAERMVAALRAERRVLIHGDYDADGISGTAVLVLGLRALGGRVEAFIPNRLTDGYGVHPDRVPEHAERADLFVTVDCGVSNVDEVAALRRAGVEVIVTDHHTRGERVPDALLIHPRAGGRDLPLTGAGVAFHLLWAVHEHLGLDAPLEYADLATLGTVADVAPLVAENRALVREGLERMPTSRWPGVRATVRQSRLRDVVRARDVAFALAPRLNAAGRLGEAEAGLELLTTASEQRARELAAYLDARNQDRRKIQDAMFDEARRRVDPEAPAIVVGDDAWHPGVMGIVASKLLELHYKPVFIHAKGKGSVRSTPGVSAVEALRAAAPHLSRFGGHRAAAGFALESAEIEGFGRAVTAFVARHPTPVPVVRADALLSASGIGTDLYRELDALRPYGEGHPEPRFALTERLEGARAVGSTKSTLQLRVAGVKGVAWRMGDLAETLPVGRPVDVALTLAENEWKGRTSLEFRAAAVRAAAPLALAAAPGDDPAPRPADLARIRRGAPADSDAARIVEPNPSGGATGVPPFDAGSAVWLRGLPLPAGTAERLGAAWRAGTTLHVDLGGGALDEVRRAALAFPSLHDVRRAFVALRRGHALPFGETKNRRVRRVLDELELVDAAGRALRTGKRDPFDSPTLREGLLERYRLEGIADAYGTLDDDGFARTVATLLFERPPT